jgi:23S rRNA (cytidine1920-2'-O)/16S rRNA (cytidine1409-2'-O)-methyltransferase
LKKRLDTVLAKKKLVATRSQAESFIKLGTVKVNGRVVTKPGAMVNDADIITISAKQQYVSRAGLKLASVADMLKLNFNDKVVLDVGSSTGGFTDFALRNGAKKVFAVDVGTDQLHPTLRGHERIELHEKTDIRDFKPGVDIDIVVMDVSFISLREILPHIAQIISKKTEVVAMAKPQFEARNSDLKHKGVIKNDSMRRSVLKDLESWVDSLFIVLDKRDSDVAGAKGNKERFYILKKK